MLKFTPEHEWLRIDGDVAVVGITQHAQERLGDLVFVELPESGKSFKKGAPAAVVESVKAASEVYAPISGQVRAAMARSIKALEACNQTDCCEHHRTRRTW